MLWGCNGAPGGFLWPVGLRQGIGLQAADERFVVLDVLRAAALNLLEVLAPGTALDAVRVDAEFLHSDTRRRAASESQDPVPVADTGPAAADDAAKQDHVRGQRAHADQTSTLGRGGRRRLAPRLLHLRKP